MGAFEKLDGRYCIPSTETIDHPASAIHRKLHGRVHCCRTGGEKTGLQATSRQPSSCHAKTRALPMTIKLPDYSLPSSLGS